jgi:hypothetical protein
MGPRQTSESALVTAGLIAAKSLRCRTAGMRMVLRKMHLKTRTSTSPASSILPRQAFTVWCSLCPVDGVCCVSRSSSTLNWVQGASLCGYSRRLSRSICSSSAPPIRTPAFPLRRSSCSDHQNAPKTLAVREELCAWRRHFQVELQHSPLSLFHLDITDSTIISYTPTLTTILKSGYHIYIP